MQPTHYPSIHQIHTLTRRQRPRYSPRPDPRPSPATWRPICAALCVCAGLAVMATAGMVGPNGLNPIWPLLPVAGLAVFGVLLPPRRKSV